MQVFRQSQRLQDYLQEKADQIANRKLADPDLGNILSKDEVYRGADCVKVLSHHEFPPRPRPDEDTITVYRGDFDGLEKRGIYSFFYSQYGLSLEGTLAWLQPDDLRVQDDTFFPSDNLEKLMLMHAIRGGYSPFISCTNDRQRAAAFPLNGQGVVYEIRVPSSLAIVNYANKVDSFTEILIPDMVYPPELRALRPDELMLDVTARAIQPLVTAYLSSDPDLRSDIAELKGRLHGGLPSAAALHRYAPRAEWFNHDPYGLHGISHEARVLVFAELLGRLGNLDMEVLRWAAAIHDTQRQGDSIDPDHGARASRTIARYVTDTRVDKNTLAYVIRWHSPEDHEAPEMTPELAAFKDAGTLDRHRLNEFIPEYLRTDQSRLLIRISRALNDLSAARISFAEDQFASVMAVAKCMGLII